VRTLEARRATVLTRATTSISSRNSNNSRRDSGTLKPPRLHRTSSSNQNNPRQHQRNPNRKTMASLVKSHTFPRDGWSCLTQTLESITITTKRAEPQHGTGQNLLRVPQSRTLPINIQHPMRFQFPNPNRNMAALVVKGFRLEDIKDTA
jgi:hypothetical protein